jgi:hypothetical protein
LQGGENIPVLNYRDWNWLKSTSHKQLELELSPLEGFLQNYISTAPPASPPSDGVNTAAFAISLTQEARAELDNHRVQNAWALFYKAELETYKILDPIEIKGRAGKILFEDTSLLDDNAKQYVRLLIGKDSGNGDWKLQDNLNTKDVVQARHRIQDYYNDEYTWLGLTMQMLSILAAAAVLLTIAIMIALTGIPNDAPPTNLLFWFTIGLFGAVGGSTSGLLGIRDAFTTKSGTPERVLNKWITIAKPVIGFAAAVIITLFIKGGLLTLENITITNYVIYAMAFVSGFSERLIIGAVQARLPSDNK